MDQAQLGNVVGETIGGSIEKIRGIEESITMHCSNLKQELGAIDTLCWVL